MMCNNTIESLYSIQQKLDVTEIPLHIFSCFATPLAMCVFVSFSFGEKFLKDRATMVVSIKQHAWQSFSGISVWFFYSLFLKQQSQEVSSRSYFHNILNLVIHFFMSDCMLYWIHRAFHIKKVYFIHRQHHTHKTSNHAPVQMSALSGTCVHVLDIVINGHLPIFIPCLVVSIPFAWMIWYVLATNFWLSLLHCTGTRVDQVPSLGGLLVTPNLHARHHDHGRRNNHNFGVFLTLWDRLMGTYQP